jgi:mannose-6-phosphate isomerase-like protein (cupin superfamily)
MRSIIRPDERERTPTGTVRWEGEASGFRADGEDLEAGPGDIVVVGPETPHKFENLGPGRLDLVCVHASPRIIQDLED